MQINTSKTKEMIFGSLIAANLPLLSISAGSVERVSPFKLLGLNFDASLSWSVHITIIGTKASKRLYFLKQLKTAGVPGQQLLHFSNIAPQSGTLPSLDHRLNSWSRYTSVLFTLFILSLEACHILIYCSSLNLPPLNPGVTNFQGHSFKILLTHPLPSIIYFPLHVIRLPLFARPVSRTKNIAPLLTTP